MLDPKILRNDLATVIEQLQSRGFTLDQEKFLALENARKDMQTKTQELQNQRNAQAKKIGQAKAQGEDISEMLRAGNQYADELKSLEESLASTQIELNNLLAHIPNLPHSSVPVGTSEEQNVVLRTWGEPTTFSFTAKDHVDLGAKFNGMDFNAGVKLTKSRFVVLSGKLAKLYRAIIQFMIDTHSNEHGYEELCVPFVVNGASLYGTGQLPKMKEDLFELAGDEELYLIPTAEVPVTNTVRDEIIDIEKLPLKYVCFSPCFRSEAGSYGKDTRGMIRQHQFEKVELVQIVHPDHSYAALEQLTSHAETILQKLKLPYRVMSLCTGDMGFAAAKTYDLEVWLPGQQCYREISSCSNTESFQARRMSARFRGSSNAKPELVHTLNGSALAAGRTLVAVMENYQDADGNITVPEVLLPYMHGVTLI